MTIKLKRRTAIRIISFSLSLVAVLTAFALTENHKKNSLALKINNSYSKSLNELNLSVEGISKALQKSVYTETPGQFFKLSKEITENVSLAKSALSALPGGTAGELATINKFLSHAGDYTAYLSKKMANEEKITEEERDNLEKLLKISSTISEQLGGVNAKFDNHEKLESELESTAKDIENTENLESSFLEIEENITDYPTLIYDGPFSDHILNSTPSVTKDKEPITRTEASKIAAEFLGVDENTLNVGEDEDGTMKCFGFYTDDAVISITENGGYVVYFRKMREATEGVLTYEQCLQKAKEYLEKTSQLKFEESYYIIDEGVCTMNFAYKNGATVCYTDLIKVGVSTDNGDIVLLESRGFLMNHKKRTVETPKYTIEQAQKVISKKLKVISKKQALIPTDGNDEVLCYEFKCEGENRETMLVYVNSNTLKEENILTVINTEGGILTE